LEECLINIGHFPSHFNVILIKIKFLFIFIWKFKKLINENLITESSELLLDSIKFQKIPQLILLDFERS